MSTAVPSSFWKRNRSFLLVVIGLPTITAAILSALLPAQYLSVATAIPSNARLTDVNRLSGNTARELYPVFGEADDLDRIYEVCKSSTVTGQINARFQLAAHYGLNPDKAEDQSKAQKKLVKNTEWLKTETGELRVKVWDRDPSFAAAIANAYLNLTDSVHRKLVADLHGDALKGILKATSVDSSRSWVGDIDPQTTSAALDRSLLAQRTVPPALMILDVAQPALKPDRPDILWNTTGAFLVSAFTALAALLLFAQQPKPEDQ
jgi:hypothetical protein